MEWQAIVKHAENLTLNFIGDLKIKSINLPKFFPLFVEAGLMKVLPRHG